MNRIVCFVCLLYTYVPNLDESFQTSFVKRALPARIQYRLSFPHQQILFHNNFETERASAYHATAGRPSRWKRASILVHGGLLPTFFKYW
jgi:hypothetical protein